MTTIDTTNATEITPEVEDEIIINAVVVTDKDGNATIESAWMTLEEAFDHAKEIAENVIQSGGKIKIVSASNQMDFVSKRIGSSKDDYVLASPATA